MKHNKRQIEEAIARWSAYMLENDMVTENELKHMIGESIFKKAKSSIKGIFKNIAAGTKEAAEAIHDFFKPNKGAQQMKDALQKIKKFKQKNKDQKVKFDDVKLYAKLGDDDALPVVGFDNVKKKYLVLIVNPENASAQPLKIRDFLRYVGPAFDVKEHHDITDYVQAILCAKANDAAEAKMNESTIMLESYLSDYIEKNNLSKEEALSPKHMAALRKLTKTGEDRVRLSIDKYFGSKEKDDSSKKPAKDDAKKPPKKSKKDPGSDFTDDAEIEEEPVEKKEEKKPAITILDNKLLGVSPKQNSLGFVFSKSKREIQIDNAFGL